MKTERASGGVSRRVPLKTKRRVIKKKAGKSAKRPSRNPSWFDQIAPEDWIPSPYLHMIRRKRNAKKSIH